MQFEEALQEAHLSENINLRRIASGYRQALQEQFDGISL
jgi:hypothetical protein